MFFTTTKLLFFFVLTFFITVKSFSSAANDVIINTTGQPNGIPEKSVISNPNPEKGNLIAAAPPPPPDESNKIPVSVVKSQDVDNGDAEQIDTHLAAEVGDITPNETDNKSAEYDVDTKNDPVPLPPAPPPVDTNTQGAAEIAPTKKPLGKKARSGKLLNGNPFDDSSYGLKKPISKRSAEVVVNVTQTEINLNETTEMTTTTTTPSTDSTTVNRLLTTPKILSTNPKIDPELDPMTSRIAPNDQSSQQGTAGPPYVISAQRLDDIRKNFMYPYYDQGGNEDTGDYQKYIQSSTPQVHKNLNFQLPFFGFRFNYTRISLNGYLEFSDPPPNYVYPLVFPVKEWPKKNDPSFIGIFFSKCRIGNLRDEDVDQRAPGVYFRLERDLRDRRDRMGVEIRERIKADIREGVIGADSFDPKHLIITTWKNISFNGGIGNALYTTNTFQMVLVTDEVFTYAMFNYQNLLWTSHTEAGGDTTNGEGGTSAFVGFNAGNGTRSHEYLPYSQASVIRDLTQTGFANNKSGRHIFRIDEDILLGSCNKDIDGANLKLNFAPESGNMLGGTIVNITGPCFNEYDEIRCKFDVADEVYGKVVDKNRAICIQPRLNVEGYVRLEIAVGSGPFKWKGKYYVETPSQATQKIFFKDMKQHEKSPGVIKMTWERYNLTTNTAANLQLSLWGYRETTIHPEFIFIRNLDSSMPNTGEYNIIPQNYRQNDDEFKTDVRFGFIQINYTESVESKFNGKMIELTPVVWSRPIPLGWYFGPQWERMYGSKWTEYLCNDWLRTDRYLKNFAHELPQCPCTLEQALADKGRFMPDFDCDKDSNPQCYYNNQAIHCVKTGSPTLEGSEQQCCYDKNKYLMLSYDQQWGSSPRRCHNVGLLPYNEATKVPTLSQWYNDMAPKYFCCLWQDEQSVGCETLRFERRPTQDCVAYQPPGIAGVYGDPHIVTFNDVPYTFNGKGEFVLTKSFTPTDNLEIQGRFEQMPMNAYGEVRATQLTSVAARGNSSTVIEVRSRPQESRWRYHMDVIADGKRVYFDRPSLKFQHFPGVTVYTPTYILNQSEVIIMFDNGVGVEVVENQGFMAARAYIPWSFINKTRGLFGNFSFGINDDFYLPDGRKVALDPNDSTGIYNDFGKEWILTDVYKENVGKSLFYREYGKTASNYNNVTFAPVIYRTLDEYLTPNKSALKEKVLQFCPENLKECIYDYALTENRDVAHFTSNYKASIFALKDTTKQTTVSCGILETPRFGRKSTFLFVPGTKVTFECNQEFVLIGDPRRTCLPSGQWDVPEYGYTECLRQQEYSQKQAGVAAGVTMAVIIPLILLFVFLGYRYLKSKKEDEANELAQEQAQQEKQRQAQEMAARKLTEAAELSSDEDDNKTESNFSSSGKY